jgi:hypothetical protein
MAEVQRAATTPGVHELAAKGGSQAVLCGAPLLVVGIYMIETRVRHTQPHLNSSISAGEYMRHVNAACENTPISYAQPVLLLLHTWRVLHQPLPHQVAITQPR